MTAEQIQRDMRYMCRRTTTLDKAKVECDDGMRLLKADAGLVSWNSDNPGLVFIDFYRYRLPEYVI